MDPDAPAVADAPELSASMPDAPAEPASAVATVTSPLDVPDPAPLVSDTAPPVDTVLARGECQHTTLGSVTAADRDAHRAARAAVAAPDPISTSPLAPELDVPELNTSIPLTPVEPAFAVRRKTSPLDVASPSPLNTATLPPLTAVLAPAATCTAPPDNVPMPPVRLTGRRAQQARRPSRALARLSSRSSPCPS